VAFDWFLEEPSVSHVRATIPPPSLGVAEKSVID
jgi:hypothetical protein